MRVVPLAQTGQEAIYVEIDENVEFAPAVAGGGTVAGVGGEELVARLDALGGSVATVCRSLMTRAIESLHDMRPSELEIEFGLKLAGEVGVPLVTKGSAEGNIKVKAKWAFGKA